MNTKKLMSDALVSLQAGNINLAKKNYKKVLAKEPGNTDACHFMGAIACQEGHFQLCVELISKAITINSNNATFHNNLGKGYEGLNKLDDARSCFEKAILINPSYAIAYFNLGKVCHGQMRFDDAVEKYQTAISLQPNLVQALQGLGNTLKEQGKTEEAVKFLRQAVELSPKDTSLRNDLGSALSTIADYSSATENFLTALAINPNSAAAHNNLGIVLRLTGQYEEAITHFERAMMIDPSLLVAYQNCGIVYMTLRRYAEAEKVFTKLLSKEQDSALTFDQLGSTYAGLWQLDEALRYHRKAIAAKPGYASAHSNLLLQMNYAPEISPADIYNESCLWGAQHSAKVEKLELLVTPAPLDGRRLRVGYLSADFKTHSVAYFFEPLLLAHNAEKIEVYCYSSVTEPDDVTTRLRQTAEHWADVSDESDDAIANRVKMDKIDILVDLAGHTGNNHLLVFARKPAPIQISWLGYPNTTGMKSIDYRITDGITDEPASNCSDFYSEELVRLEHGFLCYRGATDAPHAGLPPMLENGFVTFGSFNNLLKVNANVIQTWAAILHSVPNSRLLLKARQFAGPTVIQRIQKMFDDLGVTADRLDLLSRVPSTAHHLDMYNNIDIALDTFPYNGTTTTCEALWMGVPVIALLGERHAGRVGASILHHAGYPELVAKNIDQYRQLATNLAGTPAELQENRMARRRDVGHSTLCNAEIFAQGMELAYLNMWHAHI